MCVISLHEAWSAAINFHVFLFKVQLYSIITGTHACQAIFFFRFWSISTISLYQSKLLKVLKRSLETPGSTDVDVPSKMKRTDDDKKKYEVKHVRKFQPACRKDIEWVYEERTNKMHCSTCRKYPELTDKSSPMYIGCGDGVQGFKRETLTAHSKSHHHVLCHTRLPNDQNQEDRPLEIFLFFRRLENNHKQGLKKLFNTAHYITNENLSSQKSASICDLQVKNKVDLGSNYRNPKADFDFDSTS